MSDTKIIDRIKKILELAKNSSNEEEAATAAARAAELMTKFEITEAELAIEAGVEHTPEPIEHHVIRDDGKVRQRRSAWRGIIAGAVAQSYGCRSYFQGGHVVFFGRTSGNQACTYTYQYLCNEVEALTSVAWIRAGLKPSKSLTKSWKNAFRIGAARTIASRLTSTQKVVQEALKTALETAPESTQTQALMVIDREAEEVETGYQEVAKTFTRTNRIGRVSRLDGYAAGTQAGADVALDGSGRARLNKGTEVFPQ